MKQKILKISLIISIILVLALATTLVLTNKAYRLGLDEIRQSEIKYSTIKSELITEVKDYIDSIAPLSGIKAYILVDECEKEDIQLSFVLAQGEIESHFGTKGIAAKTNNPWNIGAFDNLTYNQILSKYKYNDPNDAIKPYLRYLKARYLTTKTEEGLLYNFVDVYGNRYASDVHYEERLRYKYELIKKQTNIDSLERQMKYWGIKANRL